MSFVGAFCRTPGTSLSPETCRELAAASGLPGPGGQEFESQGFYLAISDEAVVDAGDRPGDPATAGITAVAGDPLFRAGPVGVASEPKLRVLGSALQSGNDGTLTSCRGTFAAVSHSPADRRLVLATDSAGVRPVYFAAAGPHVIFASTLRALEQAPSLRLAVDLRGAIEEASFGFALGDRTPYAGVRRLRAAESVRFEGASVNRRYYFDWLQAGGQLAVTRDRLRQLYQVFVEAIRLRGGDLREAEALLSGGLDSRCIVAALHSLGVRLFTYNFSWPGTLDAKLGREFARRVGASHFEESLPYTAGGESWPFLVSRAIRREESTDSRTLRRVWSGDGGSVGLGRVYLDQEMVHHMREGNPEAALAEFFRVNPVDLSRSVLHSALRDRVRPLSWLGVREEVLAADPIDSAQRLFLFLLLNDQRHHLDAFFENTGQHRLEYLLPFYDAEVMRLSASFALDECLGHRMYNRWTAEFPSVVRDIPWQSYPGHEPGPLVPAEGESQWSERHRKHQRKARRRQLDEQIQRVLASPGFPEPLVDRRRVRLAAAAHKLGATVSHALEFVIRLERRWSIAQGRYV